MAVRSALINVMMKAAEKAAKSLKRDFGEVEHLQISRKGPADFVSNADMESQRILREEGPKFVQSVWQPGAAQPVAQARDDAPEVAEQLGPDDAARTLFGLLKAPAADELKHQDASSEPVAPVASPVAHLGLDQVRRLQSALHELRECRRLVDQTLQDSAV